MKAGRGSVTAELVCMARAYAQGRSPVSRFDDPTALELLPAHARAIVERARAGESASGLRERTRRKLMTKQADMMVVRTVAIDDAIRAAGSPQLTILGAGLDGRAWRMPELGGTLVFEVDHPDSQRDKRARVGRLALRAREVRFAPVDFARDDLDAALAGAGHDPARPTTWVWEGVVMYLTREAIAATLAIVARRSAVGSRLVVLYHSPSPLLPIMNLIVSRLGEPLRSSQTPGAMRWLFAQHGFTVVQDDDIAGLGGPMTPNYQGTLRMFRHLRVATGDKR
jgi:methyltransferase (TIGR00027 family)